MYILTPDEVRRAEDNANKNGLSYDDMMESAGMGCAEHILKSCPDMKNTVIICGKGKNGGDGFVIARALYEAGKNVNVILAFNSPSDELSEKNKKLIYGAVNFYDGCRITKSICDIIENADVIVDAVFGIGFKGKLPRNVQDIFAVCNKSHAVRFAVDIPSGLSCLSDNSDGCFTADETLSMLCFKKEHVYKPWSDKCGKVTVIPIGFGYIGDAYMSVSDDEVRNLLPSRPYDSNKGTFGKALIIAGSYSMPGASVIAAKGSLCTGAGLTYLAFPDRIYNTVTSHLTECVFRPLPSDENGGFSEAAFERLENELRNFDAIAIGPGLATGKGASELVEKIVRSYKGKLIIDADGINIISRNINILKESEADILLTPHPGEAGRLISVSAGEVNARREEIAADFAEKYGVTVLLKGANTVIADKSGKVYINRTGSTALSRGGSGDLLTGIAVSFAAQGLSVTDAGILAAFIHGKAGETAEKKYTAYGADVGKITHCVPKALSKIVSGK